MNLSFKQVRIVSAVLVSNVGASNSTNSVTSATVQTGNGGGDLLTQLQSSLDYSNLTVQYNLGSQPTTKQTGNTKQTSVAYELAHAAGLV